MVNPGLCCQWKCQSQTGCYSQSGSAVRSRTLEGRRPRFWTETAQELSCVIFNGVPVRVCLRGGETGISPGLRLRCGSETTLGENWLVSCLLSAAMGSRRNCGAANSVRARRNGYRVAQKRTKKSGRQTPAARPNEQRKPPAAGTLAKDTEPDSGGIARLGTKARNSSLT